MSILRVTTFGCWLVFLFACGFGGSAFRERAWPAAGHGEVVKSLVGELPELERVYDLELRGSTLLATGRAGIYRSVAGSRFEISAPYESDETMFPARRLAGGRVVGQGSKSQKIHVFAASGERQVFAWRGKVHKIFDLGRVSAGSELEILLIPQSHTESVSVRSLGGAEVTAVRSEFHISDFGAEDFDGDGVGEIVLYEYPIAPRRGGFKVLRPTGETICRWELPEVVGRFTILQWPGEVEPVIMTNPGDEYLVSRMCGEPVARLEAPNASWFRSMRALWFGEGRWLAVTATGSGYRPHHSVAIFAADGELVHYEAGKGRSYALSEGPDGVLVGVDNEVYRFDLPEL